MTELQLKILTYFLYLIIKYINKDRGISLLSVTAWLHNISCWPDSGQILHLCIYMIVAWFTLPGYRSVSCWFKCRQLLEVSPHIFSFTMSYSMLSQNVRLITIHNKLKVLTKIFWTVQKKNRTICVRNWM